MVREYIDIWELLPETWQVETAEGACFHAGAFLRLPPHHYQSRTFESCAWATYDMAFRRQAAYRGSLDWGVVDAALYSEAFAGRAKVIHGEPPIAGPLHTCQQGRSPTTPAVVELFRLYNTPGGLRC